MIILTQAVLSAVSAVCPVISVQIVDPSAPATWKLIPAASATPAQITAGQNALSTFDLAGWTASQASNTSRLAAMLTDTNVMALLAQANAATPAQIDTWVQNNVTNIATAQVVLSALIKIVATLAVP